MSEEKPDEKPPFTEEQIDWLRQNLSIELRTAWDYYSEDLIVELKLGGEVISQSSWTIPGTSGS